MPDSSVLMKLLAARKLKKANPEKSDLKTNDRMKDRAKPNSERVEGTIDEVMGKLIRNRKKK